MPFEVDGDSIHAAIMAGGRGTRLRPLTETLPKPLIPIGGRAAVDYVLDLVQAAGVPTAHLLLGHQATLVRSHIRSHRGAWPAIRISALTEPWAMGTAGPLQLLEDIPGHLVVVNGDLLTTTDLSTVIGEHFATAADLTLVSASYRVTIPFGVLHPDAESWLSSIEEKPTLQRSVSIGIYVLGPRARRLVEDRGPDDMPALINRAVRHGLAVRQHQLAPSTPWCDLTDPRSISLAEKIVRGGGFRATFHERPLGPHAGTPTCTPAPRVDTARAQS